jgi:hypothetical protein
MHERGDMIEWTPGYGFLWELAERVPQQTKISPVTSVSDWRQVQWCSLTSCEGCDAYVKEGEIREADERRVKEIRSEGVMTRGIENSQSNILLGRSTRLDRRTPPPHART